MRYHLKNLFILVAISLLISIFYVDRCLSRNKLGQKEEESVYLRLQGEWNGEQSNTSFGSKEAFGKSWNIVSEHFNSLAVSDVKELQGFMSIKILESDDFNKLLFSLVVEKAIHSGDENTLKSLLVQNASLLSNGIAGDYLEMAIALHDLKAVGTLFETYMAAEHAKRYESCEAIAECLRRAFCTVQGTQQLNDANFVTRSGAWFHNNFDKLRINPKYVKPSTISAPFCLGDKSSSYGLFVLQN